VNARRVVVLPIIFIVGCASLPRSAGFNDVQATVADRTAHVIQWRGQTADDAAVDQAVSELLAHDLTADQAVQIALLNNRALQATFEDLGVAQADLVQAGLLKNPVFAASWRFADRAPSSTNAEYSVTQDFLELFVLPLRKRLAEREFERAKLSVAHQVLQLAAEVKSAFYTAQAREQLIDRLRLIVQINQTAAELANRQRQAGTLNELGQVTQQAAYDQSKLDVAQAESQLATDREHLNRLLGLWGPQTSWKLSNRLPPLPETEIDLQHLESLAMRQRLDLAAAGAELNILQQAVAITQANRGLANLELGIDTEKETDGQHVTGPTLDLQLPIFDQGQAQIARARAQLRQFQRRFEGMAIDARSEVREARDRLVAQRAMAQYYRVLLPQRVHILELTLQQYNGMLKGAYDLLLAKQNEVATERAYIEAWRDYWIARAQLEQAVGGRLPADSSLPATLPATQSAPPDSAVHQHHNTTGQQP
jgi:cobalt-zinc-cadmium efflux system outer membrane protein